MRPYIYDARTRQLARGSYFDVMRRYVMEQARLRGFEVLDLQPRFVDHVSKHRRPMEFPTDNHWNALGHEVAEEAIAHSSLYEWFRSLTR